MHTTDNPMKPNDQHLAELTEQHARAVAQFDALAGQIKAAVRREADLRQQLNASQAELAKLGFMQLGKKMIVKAEQDNIRKKLAANQQLQESLMAKQQACQEQQAALEAQIAQAHMTPAPAPVIAPASPVEEPAPAPVIAPPAPAEKPAPMPVIAPPPVADAPATRPVIKAAAPKKKAAAPRLDAPAPRPAAPRAPRTPRLDAALPLEEQVSQLLARLEALYPARQVFALESICAELNTRLNALATHCGCANAAEFLAGHGFTIVSGAQGRALHLGKYCTPGQEPEGIRPLLMSVLRRLERHYPDHVISRSIQHDHKSLAQDVSSLCQWLGYATTGEMLTAYGFRYQVAPGGRPATDAQALLDTLRTAYAEGEKPRTISSVMADHPELAHALKTLQNQAPARFGMPLKKYLAEQGILAKRADKG